MKNAWRYRQRPLHLDPVAKVIAHVIAAKGKHRHRIAADLSDLTGRGCRHLGTHSGAHVNARAPIEGLVDERNGMSAAATKDDCADGDSGRILPSGIYCRALFCWRSKTGVRVRGFGPGLLANFWRPAIALPVNALCRWLVGHAFPPNASFGSERDVGEDCVLGKSGHGVGI